jgi:ABC-type multidrug transport system fused ATPase/permease subunit
MQKSEPFEDTILGNLLFGVSHRDMPISYKDLSVADKKKIHDTADLALFKAGLTADMFPQGIRTWIGYKGLKLSGGQQQRLQIAAAHMKLMTIKAGPSLITADEPTASLDSLSELTVMKHLQDNLPEETTLLMVAHRLSTVANMDRIVFVRPLAACPSDTPQVTVHSSLAELYASEGLFREMADAQGFKP